MNNNFKSKVICLPVDYYRADHLAGESDLVKFAWINLLLLVRTEPIANWTIQCWGAKDICFACRMEPSSLPAVERMLEVAQQGEHPAISIKDGILTILDWERYRQTSAERVRAYRNRKRLAGEK